MKIFSDRHHDGLAFSLHLLAKRIGAELFFPVGTDWATEGYWLIHKPYNYSQDTVKQYLSLDQRYRPVDGTLPLNTINSIKPTHYEVLDLAHHYTMKSITLEQFKQMDIDVIIASIPDHAVSFKALRDKYKPHAKLVFQCGNNFGELSDLIKEGKITNLLASTNEQNLPISIPTVYYHQEILMRDFTPPPTVPKIVSLVHLLPQPEVFFRFKKELAPIEMRAYGASAPDGYKNGIEQVYKAIQDSSIIFHNKKNADGFGHVIHSAIMLGRPVIINYEEYKDRLAGQILLKGENCIDVYDVDAVSKVKALLNDRPALLKACRISYDLFRQKVDYIKEAQTISRFLDNLA